MSIDRLHPKNIREKRHQKKDRTVEHALQAGVVALGFVAGMTAYDKIKSTFEKDPGGVYDTMRDDKRLALPMYAMLARGYLSKPIDLLADPALRHIRSIEPSEVVPLTTRAAKESFIIEYQAERTKNDANPHNHLRPDEKHWARGKLQTLDDQKEVFDDAISKYKRDPIQLGQSIAMISRNISWNQNPMNYTIGIEDHGTKSMQSTRNELKPQQVTAEVSAVLKERRRLQETDPLAQSDVILLSNNEQPNMNSGKRFGNGALVEHLQYVVSASARNDASRFKKGDRIPGIKPPTPFGFTHVTTPPEASVRELNNAKNTALGAIANGTRKTTFFFDGHGSADGLFLSNGQVVNSSYVNGISINTDEMANALSKRWFNQKRADRTATTLNISIILDSCTSQNFIRNLAARLETLGVPLPQLMISSSEYGQFGFSNPSNKYSSNFWTWIINNETVGRMIDHKGDVKDQTPTIFTPRPERPTKLMQLGGVVIPNSDSESA